MLLLQEVNKVTKVSCKFFTNSLATFFLLVSMVCFGEDTELYLSDTIKQAQTRPKVLIIFDNSGSMGTEEKFKKQYKPSKNYDALDDLTKLKDNYIYYAKGSGASSTPPVPDSPTEHRRFNSAINGCQTARDAIAIYGYYNTRVREYVFQGNSGRWAEIPEHSGSSIKVIDCEDDVVALNNKNAQMLNGTGNTQSLTPLAEGYPIDGAGNKANPQLHTALAVNSNVSWTGSIVTLYSANYLRWQQNPNIAKKNRTRLEVAKESVTNLINSTPNVDFGLQIFNKNNGKNKNNGGRIVHGLKEGTLTSRATLLDIINNKVVHDSWTPLCETLYEATRYFGGKSVYYGNDEDIVPKRDQTIEKSSSGGGKLYKTPFASCSDKVFVVFLTDGEPTYDIDADDEILKLPETGQDIISSSDIFEVGGSKDHDAEYSYLPALAGWINNNDLNTNIDGKQTAETYTIGFSSGAKKAEALLKETAKRGGGEYFFATDSASLTSALTNVLANLQPSNESLTSASVAVNHFDRTETLDSVYYAMFQPDRGPRWQGNLKKYKLIDGIQKGANGVVAVDTTTGHFSEEVQSYWSTIQDGDRVSEGGVAEMLRNKTERVIYSDIGNDTQVNGLVQLTYDKATSSKLYPTPADLATALDVENDKTTIEAYLNWINGRDVDDEDDDAVTLTENRPDVFGDALHSKPVVINYGDDDIYVVVGTNHGVLHMFKDNNEENTIDETWAFMPKDFISNIKALRNNFTSSDKIYGIDGEMTYHFIDKNGNGVVDADDDSVWLFFGFRRGGSTYYAMDITDPDAPSVMWTIEGDGTGDFKELGQTWSKPKVIFSKLNITGKEAKPALVFGGGYDISKDSHGIGGANGSDGSGKAIYIVDAKTGTLKWSLAPDGDTTFTGSDSIPSSIATLDSDGDGFTDRLYAGDTGGNVWRVDMPGEVKSNFSVFKLASLGGDSSNAVDRRFFSEPTIVKTYITETRDITKKDGDKPIIVKKNVPYDAILLGSGDRTNPTGKDTNDKFFMIKDKHIKTQTLTATTDPKAPAAITVDVLADYTDNPFGENLTPQAKETLSLQVSAKSGWFMDFAPLTGEKNTSKTRVINSVVYFTSYIPYSSEGSLDSCDTPSGQGWLYAVDLSLGTNRYNWEAGNPEKPGVRKVFVSEQYLDTPILVVTKRSNPITDKEELVGELCAGRTCENPGGDGVTPKTYSTNLYITETQQ